MELSIVSGLQDHMVNVWGYSHINFFAPMARFAADGGGTFAAGRELKQLVQALHAAGIQVILDVVYNHTNEGVKDISQLPVSCCSLHSSCRQQSPSWQFYLVRARCQLRICVHPAAPLHSSHAGTGLVGHMAE